MTTVDFTRSSSSTTARCNTRFASSAETIVPLDFSVVAMKVIASATDAILDFVVLSRSALAWRRSLLLSVNLLAFSRTQLTCGSLTYLVYGHNTTSGVISCTLSSEKSSSFISDPRVVLTSMFWLDLSSSSFRRFFVVAARSKAVAASQSIVKAQNFSLARATVSMSTLSLLLATAALELLSLGFLFFPNHCNHVEMNFSEHALASSAESDIAADLARVTMAPILSSVFISFAPLLKLVVSAWTRASGIHTPGESGSVFFRGKPSCSSIDITHDSVHSAAAIWRCFSSSITSKFAIFPAVSSLKNACSSKSVSSSLNSFPLCFLPTLLFLPIFPDWCGARMAIASIPEKGIEPSLVTAQCIMDAHALEHNTPIVSDAEDETCCCWWFLRFLFSLLLRLSELTRFSSTIVCEDGFWSTTLLVLLLCCCCKVWRHIRTTSRLLVCSSLGSK